ncbi:ABC-type multidrug transport system, ATPase/permease component [Melissococcus plutonius]|uniref:Lipid A export ATP-binding/permease protein MsbA n=1 Tax=Melissococcus plutonius (strain ATCC 35311 / DSM 29964 / CIP 104052 / LMG 20360 / NCIMB 702443) TaxID=940190 RepID=F3Y856_MELPT|nr:ABC transporter ATP-binding protein [Melissococcus plutonius]AIM24428.1 ABC-type multidrug transport system, ATPase/permease component [Melissococcus plutonius S1]KMT25824.1 ABC-type multidrug transport system, ATPase/permease component [Melissococcus plutonius]KMT27169.1 ABC-type multidrug transport system, ATPase/permease component [Melissococcus plutonius]KMT28270.1 ABC-type multidrug transport system, ATPase/permease component [Melissococcus plutonius]KMT30007.1 ABC-type multidrug trans
MKLIWQYTIKYKKLLLADFICVFGFILIELGLPTILARMIDKGIAEKDFNYIKQQGLLMIIITIIGVALDIFLGYFCARITTNIVRDIRDDLFEKIQTFSHREYEAIGVSSLITRTTNDSYQIMLFMNTVLRIGFLTPMMFITSLFIVLKSNLILGLYVLGALPLLLLAIIAITKISNPLSKKQQNNLDGVNGILRENLSGLRVIRAFVNEKFEEKRFSKVNEAYTKSSQNLFRLMAAAQPGFYFLFNIVMVLIIWHGSLQINSGSLLVGNLIAFIEYIFHALFSFMMFASVFTMYLRAAVSAKRIQEAFDLTPEIMENNHGVTQTKTKGYLEFKNVTFAYPGHAESPVIRNVSFTASPGETIAFIGSTGSGKSTLIQLIPRFYDVSEGQILVDGIDVRDYRLSTLRSKIGYIPQKALLFTGTIADNLRYGKADATLEEMKKAAEIAQATDFISKKPEGFNEQLSEGGANFSGGQKQRLAIARAVIRQPEIYIFDDSFSALDYQTDAKLRARLKEVTHQSTVMIVAQRVGTIMQADKIIVLNEGDIVGIGTHKELLATCPIYYDIAASQLSKEELA